MKAARGRIRVVLAFLGAAAVVIVEAATFRGFVAVLVDAAVGIALFAAFFVGSAQPAVTGRRGSLLGLGGIGWLAGSLWAGLALVHRGPIVHSLLGDRRGRVSLLAAPVVVGTYLLSVAPQHLRPPTAWTVLWLAGLVLLLARFVRASRAERLRTWPVTVAGCALLTVGALPALAPDLSLGYLYGLAVAAVAVATIVQRRFPLNRDGIAGVAIELGRASGGRTLGGRLADAIGDPTLVVGYRLGTGYVDEDGRPLELPAPGDGRAITPILDRSVPIAVLIHDPASLDDPRLVEAVTSLARIAIANTELRASARARLADVEASRRRLLLAGDKQRRRFADDLEQGPERRLAAVAPLLQAAAPDLAAVATEIDADLRRLGSGLMPATLVEGGLRTALEELAARSPVPVKLEVSQVDGDGEIALAAYFVCAEALANVAKHARASTATVTVAAADGHLLLAVADDGIGGADVRRGSGLRGLVDRVEALGGSVRVTSPPGRGTALEVALPEAVTRS